MNAAVESVESVESVETKSPVIIEVQNPTPEEMKAICENIKVNYNFSVVTRATNFNFKKSVDKATGIETIRSTVQLAVPYPSVDGIIAILETGGKGLDLLLESMENIVNSTARDILYEDTSLTAATFPVDKLSWEAIASIPKVQRRGGGIPKETWEEFEKDFIEVMPSVTGKNLEMTARAAKLLKDKLTGLNTNTTVLEFLVSQLGLYTEHSANISEFQECVTFLLNKADTWLNVSEEDLLASL